MESIWSEVKLPHFENLKSDIKTDVLIIGGGITGILTAYMLKNAGIDYVLVEADRILNGVTKNTTAKITVQHGLLYNRLIKNFGADTSKLYYNANLEALSKYREICKDTDCDFETAENFVYSLKSKREIERECEALLQLGAEPIFKADTPLPFAVKGAVGLKNQAQFHPLKFLSSVCKDLNIYENTKVLELTPYGAVTKDSNIKAEKTIITTHFPLLNKHGAFFLKLYQHRSYVIALKNARTPNGMYVDESEKGLSFRNYEDLLLLGGGGHRTGKKGGCWQELEDFANQHYPESEVMYRWATQDCMSLDGVPYIGQYSKNTPNLFVATGFNKWGMTSAMVSALLLKDLVTDKTNPYSEMYSPSRSIVRPQLFINAAETTLSLLTPSVPRCPHLGCALKYNREEHSWDCPCHGSRFTENGELINNPATDDKPQIKRK